MKKAGFPIGVLMIVSLGAGVIGVAVAFADQELSLQQVPAPVRATIEKHAGQGEIVEIEREIENGQVVYEAEVIVDGEEIELLVSAAGEFLGAEAEGEDDEDTDEDEDEDSIQWEQLPLPVQATLSRTLPGIQLTELTREAEHGLVVYEAAYETNGVEHEVELTEDGHLLESEEQISPAGLPAAVRAVIDSRFPNAEIEEAEMVRVTFYEIELEAGGKEHELKILANGHVLDEGDED